jgi:hypothetical protein
MLKTAHAKRIQTVVMVLLVVSLLAFALPHSVSAGTVCFSGNSKGLMYDSKGWHHYVQFNVDRNGAGWNVYGPLPSSVWGYYASKTVRAGYNWPSNWWDPFPASMWKVCLR